MAEKKVNNISSQRIRALRSEHGLRQKDLADKLNTLAERDGYNPSYCAVSVSKWESRGSTPQIRTLRYLGEIFNVSVQYLSGESDSLRTLDSLITDYNEYKALTLDDLDGFFDGLPVWVETDKKTRAGSYGLYNADNHTLIFKDGTKHDAKEFSHRIYSGPNPFTVSMRVLDEKPLDLTEIQDGVRLWVEPIHATEEVKEELRGWYVSDKKSQAFIGPNGMPLPFSLYGKSYVAFNRAL